MMRSYVFKVLDDLATLDYIHGNAVIVAHEVSEKATALEPLLAPCQPVVFPFHLNDHPPPFFF